MERKGTRGLEIITGLFTGLACVVWLIIWLS